MHYLIKSARFIFTIYAFLIFVAIMMVLLPLVVVASFFRRMKGGNYIYSLCRAWANIWMVCCFMRHRNCYESPHDKSLPCIFISNHISFVDIPMIFQAIGAQKFRVLGKYEMSRIPLFGFIYRNAVVMVNRERTTSRANSMRQMKSIIQKGVSVYIFPEGTFNTTKQPLKELYDGAFRIAIETQTPLKPILFLDTYDRMNYKSIFSLNPGRCRSVYLHEIPVEGLTIKDVPALKLKAGELMEAALLRYQASWIQQS